MDIERVTEQVTKALSALPPSARAIADFLTQHGYQGRLSETRDCPIARYLQAELTEDNAQVSVGAAAWLVRNANARPGDPYLTSEKLPPDVMKFVQQFDCGEFPNLVDAEAR